MRSNPEAHIGFLSAENRVCVALSRAKNGLYIIGNMDNLTKSSSIWPQIKDQLEKINAIGNITFLQYNTTVKKINYIRNVGLEIVNSL